MNSFVNCDKHVFVIKTQSRSILIKLKLTFNHQLMSYPIYNSHAYSHMDRLTLPD
jgi:hypothetical protein